MALPWSPEFELDYVNQTSVAELRQRHATHAAIFDVESWVKKLKPGHIATVCEVGCGAIGGMLSAYAGGEIRFAVDPLTAQYTQKFGIPSYVDDFLPGYAHELPFRSNYFDVMFCLEALDHCQNMELFYRAINELSRVLRVDGVLFFMLPARDTSREHDGHPCTPTLNQVRDTFNANHVTIRKHLVNREGIWLVLQKTESYEDPVDVSAHALDSQDEHGPSLCDGSTSRTA